MRFLRAQQRRLAADRFSGIRYGYVYGMVWLCRQLADGLEGPGLLARGRTETIPYINHTVGIDSPRSILNAAPSTGFIMCVRSDGGGLRENQTQSEHVLAFAGSTASARRRLRDRLPVDSAEPAAVAPDAHDEPGGRRGVQDRPRAVDADGVINIWNSLASSPGLLCPGGSCLADRLRLQKELC